jgi:hypothetical protein
MNGPVIRGQHWAFGSGRAKRINAEALPQLATEDTMREFGTQCVVWQTAINPVVSLELLAAGTWSGADVLGPEASTRCRS